uniref:(northern house mosquito) hypothetical protein n=1 Tax=Culex pipiens TaxID=7175 RepID=A0A8D8FUG9_CULPI
MSWFRDTGEIQIGHLDAHSGVRGEFRLDLARFVHDEAARLVREAGNASGFATGGAVGETGRSGVAGGGIDFRRVGDFLVGTAEQGGHVRGLVDGVVCGEV